VNKLTGKIAVITGGSSGIGLSAAREFVAEGAYVYVTGRRQSALDLAVADIGKNVTGVQGDSSNLTDLDRLYRQIAEEQGRIDILFANSGIGNQRAPLGEITEEQFDLTFNINVRGLLFTVQKALPLISNGGSIVLNSSAASIKGRPAMTVYSASKAAVRSFARTWTTEMKDRNIRVNVLGTGYTDTPFFDALELTAEQTNALKADIATRVPLGRLARPEEVAKAVVFLASEDSSYVAGHELFVDGGFAQI